MVFRTETDTEVATMLISKYYHRNHDLKKALDQAISEMRGTYAIAVVAKDQPDQFVAYRKNAPLIVGVGNNCNFVASDSLQNFWHIPKTYTFWKMGIPLY